MKNKNIIIGAIVAILVGFALGWTLHFQDKVGGVSSVGVSNSTSRIASITMAPLTGAATTSSILNDSGTDRIITNTFGFCSSVGRSETFLTGNTAGGTFITSAGWVLSGATTTVANQGLQGNANFGSNGISFSTTSPAVTAYNASSTEGVLQFVSRIWPVNTYYTFLFNATNTAACTVGVNYILS